MSEKVIIELRRGGTTYYKAETMHKHLKPLVAASAKVTEYRVGNTQYYYIKDRQHCGRRPSRKSRRSVTGRVLGSATPCPRPKRYANTSRTSATRHSKPWG